MDDTERTDHKEKDLINEELFIRGFSFISHIPASVKRQWFQESRNFHNLMYGIKLYKFRPDCQFGIREKKSGKSQANHHNMIFDNALNQQAFLLTLTNLPGGTTRLVALPPSTQRSIKSS